MAASFTSVRTAKRPGVGSMVEAPKLTTLPFCPTTSSYRPLAALTSMGYTER